MSQTLETVENPPAAEEWPSISDASAVPAPADHESQKFDYRPMPVLAPVAGVLGLCSLIAYLGLFGIGLALVGIPVGLMAVVVIMRSGGALSGKWIAIIGLLLSTVSAVGGIGLQVYLYQHEVWDGFTRTSFTNQISKPGFVTVQGETTIPPEVQALVGQSIFLKGFMYPTGQTEGLRHFLLLKDSGQCCFGGKPALQDMIGVVIAPGKEVDYYSGRVAIAGTFRLNNNYEGGSLQPIYLLELEHFSKAKTSF